VDSEMTEERTLIATLCEVERGLFHVAYRVDGAAIGHHNMPRYEVGATALDVQQRIGQRARECGYGAVVWEIAFAAAWPPSVDDVVLTPLTQEAALPPSAHETALPPSAHEEARLNS
jgi:hypothetical protein